MATAAPKLAPITPMRSASISGRPAMNASALLVSSTCSRQITRPRVPWLSPQPRMSKRSAAYPSPANIFAVVTLPPLSLLLPKPCRTRNAGRRSCDPRPSGRWSTPASFNPSDATVTRSSMPPSFLLETNVFERRRPRIRIDQHQRRLLDPGADAARPDILVDRRDPDPVVDDLLDLVQERLALLPVGFSRLLSVERVDVGIAAVGEGAVARVDLRHPRGGVAIEGARADAHPFELLRRHRRQIGPALHGPHLQLDTDGAQIPDDRLAQREIGWKLVQLAGIESVGVPGFGQELLRPGRVVGVRLEGQGELEALGDEVPGGLRGPERLGLAQRLAIERVARRQAH